MKNKILFLFILTTFTLFSQNKYPVLTEIVTDNAQIFSEEELVSLRNKLSNFEKKTTNQVVVLTINSLGKFETIENYANKVFNTTKIGQAGKDNGVLIVFSKNDRKVRIEVGYGLEHVLTDALSSRIIRNTMIPAFKKGNNFSGIDLATNQIIDFIKDPNLITQYIKDTEPKTPWFVYVFIIIFVGTFLAITSFSMYNNLTNLIEVFRGFFTGQISLGRFLLLFIPTLIGSFFLLPFIIIPLVFGYGFLYETKTSIENSIYDSLLAQLPLAIAIYLIATTIVPLLIALFKIKYRENKPFEISWKKTNDTYFQKTFSSSGSSSSYSSSSSSGGSSFSGGGGSSGGGGASGSW